MCWLWIEFSFSFTHVIDLLMDDRMLSLHGLLDDPGLLHLE